MAARRVAAPSSRLSRSFRHILPCFRNHSSISGVDSNGFPGLTTMAGHQPTTSHCGWQRYCGSAATASGGVYSPGGTPGSLRRVSTKRKQPSFDPMIHALIGDQGIERAAEDVKVWRRRRQTVLTAVSKGYDIKRASFLANLAHLQYFDQMWKSRRPGGTDTRHPKDFSLPLQFATGYARQEQVAGLPEGVGRVQPAGEEHDFAWEAGPKQPGAVRHGVVFNRSTDSLGMFFTNTKRRWVVLAIRGSTSRHDTVINFSFDKVDWEPTRHPKGLTADETADAAVHRGFHSAYLSIQTGVLRTVRRLFATGKFDKLYITGHSLGGALASHAALDITCAMGTHSADPIVPHVEAYTFGSPKVGNPEWAAIYDRLVPLTWRHVNDEDAVPSLPPKWSGFQHIGQLVHMNSNGIWVGRGTRSTIGVVEDGFQLSETASDHWMRGYKYMLRALYVPDETSVVLAQAWQVFINSHAFVREVLVVDGRKGEPVHTAGASTSVEPEEMGVATAVLLNRASVPDRQLLVAMLHHAFQIGIHETDAVVKEAGRMAYTLDHIWHSKITFDLFHFAFFSTLMEPHPGTRAISIAQSIARATFNRFDSNADGYLAPSELEAMCRSTFGIGINMAHVHHTMEEALIDPTLHVSFEEVFLWKWIQQLKATSGEVDVAVGSSSAGAWWLGTQDFQRSVSPFPSPEETRMGRVTVPGKKFVPQPVAPPASRAAYETDQA